MTAYQAGLEPLTVAMPDGLVPARNGTKMIGFGRYNLLSQIGQGGVGTVYLARQKTLQRFCAVKLLNDQLAQNERAAGRFLREARAAASLAHGGLTGIYDCDQFEGKYFIAMEYIEGLTVGEILRVRGPLPPPLAFHWLQQATQTLDYIHSKQLVHRDIKPDNMMVDRAGHLKIMDLGLAKDVFEAETSLTMTGAVIGSPSYMSPEQVNDAKNVDHRTDLYSLGISFYHMLTGQPPFQGSSVGAICAAHLQQPVPSVALTDATLTAELDPFIARLTAKNLDNRFQSTAELLAVLESWVALHPLDEASRSFFSHLQFDERDVGNLLTSAGVDPTTVDEDIPAATLPDTPESAIPTVLETAAQARRSRKILVLGIGVGVLLAIGVVGGFIALRQRSRSDVPAPAAPATAPVAATAAGVPRPPPEPPPPPGSPDSSLEEPVRPARRGGPGQRFERMHEVMNQARSASAEEWPATKERILINLRHALARRHGDNPDLVRGAVVEVDKLLQEIRTLSEEDYQDRQRQLANRWMRLIPSPPGERPRPPDRRPAMGE